MKPLIDSIAHLRVAHILSLVLFAAALGLAASAWAQSTKSGSWPTTEWVVMEGRQDTFMNQARGMVGKEGLPSRPSGERREIAEKHERFLEAASIWYQSHGFPAPLQWTEDENLTVDPGEAYLGILDTDPTEKGSSHSIDGLMTLTTHPEFLTAGTPRWDLMEVSAVHEIYHGIQKSMSPSLRAWNGSGSPELPGCPGDTNIDWLGEGTAAMVQVRWLEGKHGDSWGHPFKGSHRASWVRHFDQPLHEGSLPPEHRVPKEWSQFSTSETSSWFCDYGAWYFWYAVGEMIGRNERDKIAYTQYLFAGEEPWDDGGIANVDAGLKQAAEDYDAIQVYRDGLYDLYPQFVAQYLTEDRFYGKLEEVELGTPALFETTSAETGGPLGSLATRAWRFRVMLPRNASSIPYNVRFTLNAPHGTDRDALHLIVDERVVNRPVDPTSLYADVQRTDLTTPAADGAIEYLVRVANVAEMASETADAQFSLRVEVDGFYGNDLASAGELPPGFNVRGPYPWSCGGNKNSRGIFEVRTPDEAARNLDRSMPQAERNTEDWLNNVEKMRDQADKARGTPGATSEEFAAFRRQMEEAVAAAREQIKPIISGAADRARARKTTTLAATFVGQSGDGECQVTVGARLEGREGGAQVVAGAVDESLYPTDEAPEFSVRVHPNRSLRAMRAGMPLFHPLEPRRGDWEVCTMNHAEQQRAQRLGSASCPPVVCSAGKLTLEAAEQGRIAGTFEFDVVRWPEDRYGGRCNTPLAREKVVGHFNVNSTDDGYQGKGLTDITPGVAGAPML
ncbi:hypothetical protein [Lysobacter sp. A289]